jgi:hypothetical protein
VVDVTASRWLLGTPPRVREAAGMNRPIAALGCLLALALTGPASAEGPATIHGVVYDCATRHAIVGAFVTLRGVDSGEVFRARSDERGRFVHVGMTPGHWLIEASTHPGTDADRDTASRMALLETGDVLEMVIGTRLLSPAQASAGHFLTTRGAPRSDETPRPLCDPARVPPAPSTSDRYIIH